MPRVAAWIAPTAFVANWHLARGFARERMHFVGHGIDLPGKDIVRAKGGHNSGSARSFAYIGGLAHPKGVHVLVDAFNELPPSARLLIAGDETAFPEYCAFLRSRAKHPGIEFSGRLDREEVWQNLYQADVLVVPSIWYETASLVIQEAFAVGTPVVAANLGALAERVQDETDGLLTPPGDVLALRQALQRLMDEPALLAHLRRGIKPVLGLEEHQRSVEFVYRQVLA
jgi:glycosyltransferase involved in cell wall biosynthesis